MRDFKIDVFGLVRDSPSSLFHKGLMGSYFASSEFEAAAIIDRILSFPRVERVELRQYNKLRGEFLFIRVEFVDDFFARRNLPVPDYFFRVPGPGKTSFQCTLDGAGVYNEN